MRISLLSLIFVLLSGCGVVGFPGVYKINIEQGNIITQDMVDQLKPGMSRRQVRFILGTPLVEDSFNQTRWDYAYVTRNGNKTLSEQQLTVHFEGDTLSNFTSTLTPRSETEASAATESEEPNG
ncbi:MAG: outer membrane protein assembly factor BamE [Halioglobus sp.]|jgi:outer membrane protein assembly factor BamE